MNLLDGFFAPGRLALESEGFLYFLNPVLLILPFALLFIKNKTVTRLAIPAILYPLVVLFFLSKPNLRYLLPSVAPLTIVVAFMMVKLSERFLPRVAGRRLVIALAFVALGPTIVGSYLTLRGQAFPHLIGVSSANDYMASRIPWVYVDVMNYANNELTPDDRILMLFDARGFYFKPQVIQDNLYRNYSQLFAKLPPDSCLESLGITHVMLHASTVDVFADQAGRGPQGLNWGVFDEFEARCLEPVHENPSFVLYRVKGLQENPQRPD